MPSQFTWFIALRTKQTTFFLPLILLQIDIFIHEERSPLRITSIILNGCRIKIQFHFRFNIRVLSITTDKELLHPYMLVMNLSFCVLCMMTGSLSLMMLGSLYEAASTGYPFCDIPRRNKIPVKKTEIIRSNQRSKQLQICIDSTEQTAQISTVTYRGQGTKFTLSPAAVPKNNRK